MSDSEEKQSDPLPTFDPQMQTENIAFRPDEMQACAACGRMNPPTRIKCLYCAVELAVKPENSSSIKPTLRKPEVWERGFNVVLRQITGEPEFSKIASFLSAEVDEIKAVIDAGSPLPIARVESETEGDLLIDGLSKFGLRCSVMGDLELDSDRSPVRLSNIDFREDAIAVTDFNTRKISVITDLALIIPGVLTSGKVDSLEKKRRGGKTKLLNEMATTSDQSILDIYSRSSSVGFRVHLAGFDFSCLGEDKGMIAVENLRRLVVALKEFAPHAKLIADYPKVRHALGSVWEIEQRKDPQGLQRAGFGKVEFGSIASNSNLRQFTKYSRLQWQLL